MTRHVVFNALDAICHLGKLSNFIWSRGNIELFVFCIAMKAKG